MKKDYIFFEKYGDNPALTSTSANHIANMAKEYILNLESEIDNIKFYTTKITIIGTDKENILVKGLTDISFIPKYLKEISKAKSLIAWLREGIKAKENLLREIEMFTSEDYAEKFNISIPQFPKREESLTEDEYYSRLSLKERNEYYSLETEAAVIGKAIHNKGPVAKERTKYTLILQNPSEIEGSGRDTIIKSYEPTVSQEQIEEIFFELQKRHREAQARLNAIKNKCQQALNEDAIRVLSKYEKEVAEYKAKSGELEAQCQKYRQEQTMIISKYKIVIPDSLIDIYNTINSLGK